MQVNDNILRLNLADKFSDYFDIANQCGFRRGTFNAGSGNLTFADTYNSAVSTNAVDFFELNIRYLIAPPNCHISILVYTSNIDVETGNEVLTYIGRVTDKKTYRTDGSKMNFTVLDVEEYLDNQHKYKVFIGAVTDFASAVANIKAIKNSPFATQYEVAEQIKNPYDVPSYWMGHLDTKIALINAKTSALGNNQLSFVFITDMHYPNNFKHSTALIKHLVSKTSVNAVVVGGDSSQNGTLAQLITVRDDFYPLHPLIIRGNHDYSDGFTKNNFYALFTAYHEMNTKGFVSNKLQYYYVDNTDLKVRMIFVDEVEAGSTPIYSQQFDWLDNAITSLSSSWYCLIFTHGMFSNALRTNTNAMSTGGTQLQTHINSIYNSIQCNFIGVISGHAHLDYHKYDATNGWVMISTTTDANGALGELDEWNGGKTSGTITEQAFDVYQIDLTNKKIYTTRIGNGSDREIDFRIGT